MVKINGFTTSVMFVKANEPKWKSDKKSLCETCFFYKLCFDCKLPHCNGEDYVKKEETNG